MPDPQTCVSRATARFEAAQLLAGEASRVSPRYEGEDGVRKLLAEPGAVEHAYKCAQQANPHGGAEYLADITAARNLLSRPPEQHHAPAAADVQAEAGATAGASPAERLRAALERSSVQVAALADASARLVGALDGVLRLCEQARGDGRHPPLFLNPDVIEDRMLAALETGGMRDV
jgi:hypothetical protein